LHAEVKIVHRAPTKECPVQDIANAVTAVLGDIQVRLCKQNRSKITYIFSEPDFDSRTMSLMSKQNDHRCLQLRSSQQTAINAHQSIHAGSIKQDYSIYNAKKRVSHSLRPMGRLRCRCPTINQLPFMDHPTDSAATVNSYCLIVQTISFLYAAHTTFPAMHKHQLLAAQKYVHSFG